MGKLLSYKFFNKGALKSTMLRLWGGARGTTAHDIGKNLFVFQFQNDYERCRVMKCAPWLFDNCLLLLKVFDGFNPGPQIQFTHCSFWVQFHGVPLFYMTKQTGERVAFGKVEEVDVPENEVGWGHFYLYVLIWTSPNRFRGVVWLHLVQLARCGCLSNMKDCLGCVFLVLLLAIWNGTVLQSLVGVVVVWR